MSLLFQCHMLSRSGMCLAGAVLVTYNTQKRYVICVPRADTTPNGIQRLLSYATAVVLPQYATHKQSITASPLTDTNKLLPFSTATKCGS